MWLLSCGSGSIKSVGNGDVKGVQEVVASSFAGSSSLRDDTIPTTSPGEGSGTSSQDVLDEPRFVVPGNAPSRVNPRPMSTHLHSRMAQPTQSSIPSESWDHSQWTSQTSVPNRPEHFYSVRAINGTAPFISTWALDTLSSSSSGEYPFNPEGDIYCRKEPHQRQLLQRKSFG